MKETREERRDSDGVYAAASNELQPVRRDFRFSLFLSHTTELDETRLPLFCPLSLSPEKRGPILSD